MLPIGTKLAVQAVVLVGLALAGAAVAQSVSIPDETTTYPSGVTQKPPVVSQCMGCHGPAGMSQFEDWPSLAGLSTQYIDSELQKFKSGERKNGMMQTIAKGLSSEGMQQASAYFGAKQLAVEPSKDAAKPKGVETCAACHGDKKTMLGPILYGQQRDYLLKQLQDFKDGKRKNDVMEGIAKTLSTGQIQELSDYYGDQKGHVKVKQDAH